jgi:5-methylcytosine-specific restriction endonuclease McrA
MRPPAARFLRGPDLRDEVFERDKGVCATCAKDTVAFDAQFDNIKGPPDLQRYWRAKTLREMGIPPGASLWHAHHVKAVSDGGGECGIENLITLCWRCHKAETKKQQQHNSKAEVRKRKLNRVRELRERQYGSSEQ